MTQDQYDDDDFSDESSPNLAMQLDAHQGTQTRIFNRILYKKLKSPSVMHILSAYNEDLLKMFLNFNRSCDNDVQYK